MVCRILNLYIVLNHTRQNYNVLSLWSYVVFLGPSSAHCMPDIHEETRSKSTRSLARDIFRGEDGAKQGKTTEEPEEHTVHVTSSFLYCV